MPKSHTHQRMLTSSRFRREINGFAYNSSAKIQKDWEGFPGDVTSHQTKRRRQRTERRTERTNKQTNSSLHRGAPRENKHVLTHLPPKLYSILKSSAGERAIWARASLLKLCIYVQFGAFSAGRSPAQALCDVVSVSVCSLQCWDFLRERVSQVSRCPS